MVCVHATCTTNFLAARQSQDGGFHSEYYGVLRSGYSLTALALFAISRLPEPRRRAYAGVIERGFAFLQAGTDAEGAIGLEAMPVDYPNYTAGFYLQALAALRPVGWREVAARQVAHLRTVQFAEAGGWQRDELEYGGFGYGGRAVRKPFEVGSLSISVTTAVLEGLRAVGVPADDPLFRRARVFVERCQNVPGDGGFFFTTTPEEDRSKAGVQMNGEASVPRSYAPPTCDGVRALLACGVPRDHPRVVGAVQWLRAHPALDHTPGFPAGQQPSYERGLRLYYYATLACTLDSLEFDPALRRRLRAVVSAMQREDSSWVGLSDVMKEDDPILATCLALIATS